VNPHARALSQTLCCLVREREESYYRGVRLIRGRKHDRLVYQHVHAHAPEFRLKTLVWQSEDDVGIRDMIEPGVGRQTLPQML